MLLDARRAEIVADAADRDDQRVVSDGAAPDDFPPFGIQDRSQDDLATASVQAVHATLLEIEGMGLGVAEIDDIVLMGVIVPTATS